MHVVVGGRNTEGFRTAATNATGQDNKSYRVQMTDKQATYLFCKFKWTRETVRPCVEWINFTLKKRLLLTVTSDVSSPKRLKTCDQF